MSKAIITKTGKGLSSNVTASDGDGNTYTHRGESGEQLEERHVAALRGLCAKMGWSGKLVGGYVLQQGRTIARVWVWDDSRALRVNLTAADLRTPKDLADAGYCIEYGDSPEYDKHADCVGRYWWTFTKDGMSGVDVSRDTWEKKEDAIADARRDAAESRAAAFAMPQGNGLNEDAVAQCIKFAEGLNDIPLEK